MFHFICTCCRRAMLVLALIVSVLLASTARAQDIILRVDGINGSTLPGPDGSDWGEDAFLYLQDAIDAADTYLSDLQHQNDTADIWVRGAPSTGIKYYPDDGVAEEERDESFHLRDRLSIYAGFDTNETGTEDEQFLQREPLVNITILSGDIDHDDILDDENSWHVVTAISANGGSCTIDGFTITMGYAVDAEFPGYPVDSNDNIDNVPEHAGGGMYILSRNGGYTLLHAFPNVVRCTFQNNKAAYGGAVLQHGPWHGTQQWVNCVFKDNDATVAGGAFYNYGMSDALGEASCTEGWSGATMHNCLFHDNTAPEGDGGAYWGDFTTALRMFNGTVVDNSSGIFQQFDDECGIARIWNSILYKNGVDCPGGDCAEEDQIDGQYCINYSCVQNFTASTQANCDDDGVIMTDPDFAIGSYQLDSDSPCINAGADSEVEFDTFDLFQLGPAGSIKSESAGPLVGPQAGRNG